MPDKETYQLPEIFLHEKTGASNFTYDHERRLFLINDESVGYDCITTLDLMSAIDYEREIPEVFSGLMVYALGLFSTPKWLAMYDTPESVSAVEQEVVDVMFEVFNEQMQVKSPGKPLGESLRKPDLLFGLGINFYGPGRPALNVLGNCCCYGADVSGYDFEQDEMERGYFGYSRHNIDQPFQETALLAGLGHLSKLAMEA